MPGHYSHCLPYAINPLLLVIHVEKVSDSLVRPKESQDRVKEESRSGLLLVAGSSTGEAVVCVVGSEAASTGPGAQASRSAIAG